MQETWVQSSVQEDPLEKEMATPLQHSCLENPMDGRCWELQSVWGVGHEWTHTKKARIEKTVKICLLESVGPQVVENFVNELEGKSEDQRRIHEIKKNERFVVIVNENLIGYILTMSDWENVEGTIIQEARSREFSKDYLPRDGNYQELTQKFYKRELVNWVIKASMSKDALIRY